MISAYEDKNVLITGGLGFIGSNLAKRLVGLGANVTIVDSLISEYGGNWTNIIDFKEKTKIIIADVRDGKVMFDVLKDQDFLFNLAGQTSHMDSMTDPKNDLEINAVAQLSILESCREINPDIKIVFASTRQIYGSPEYLPVDEMHPISPVDVNGINKFAGEQYHLLYNKVYGISTCVLRLTNTYGPGMRVKDARQTFLGIWIKSLIDGSPIKVFGDGYQLRDFNYVDDCVDALLAVAESQNVNGKIFNLGSSEIVDLNTLAKVLCEVGESSGFRGIIENIPFPASRKLIDIGNYYSDFSLISDSLGWNPKVSLRDGLSSTIEYYKKHRVSYW